MGLTHSPLCVRQSTTQGSSWSWRIWWRRLGSKVKAVRVQSPGSPWDLVRALCCFSTHKFAWTQTPVAFKLWC